MSQRASLIKKIQALLSKTVEAGCTEDEAMAGAALAAANALGVTLVPVDIRTGNDLAVGLQTFVRERVELVLLPGDSLVMTERRQIADLAAAASFRACISTANMPSPAA